MNPTRGAVTGPASVVKVIILNSDDAYGVVRFDAVSQSLIASESEAQQTNVTLRVSQPYISWLCIYYTIILSM